MRPLYITVCGLAVLSAGAYAQLRRYDATSGQSVAVSGTVQPITTPPKLSTPAPRGTLSGQLSHVVQKAQSVPTAVRAPTLAPRTLPPATPRVAAATKSGEILVFTTTTHLNAAVLKAVHEVREATRLPVSLYWEDQDPKVYFKVFQRLAGVLTAADEFRPDSGNYLATKYRLNQPNSMVYVAPNGTVRVYDVFENLDNLTRKLKQP